MKASENLDFVGKVELFNQIAGTGGKFDVRKTGLYFGLILEEVAEGIESIGEANEDLNNLFNVIEAYATRFKRGDFDQDIEQIDRVSALDAFVDTAVVALGGGCAIGSDVTGACHEVMDSNLSKFPLVDGKHVVIKDENGKVKKPESYWAPELDQYLV